MTKPPRMSEIVQGIEGSRIMLRETFDLANEPTMHDLLAELEALLNEHALDEELALALALRRGGFVVSKAAASAATPAIGA